MLEQLFDISVVTQQLSSGGRITSVYHRASEGDGCLTQDF